MVPDFELVKQDLKSVRLEDFLGKRIIFNIFPSIDTPTCALSVRTFNEKAASIENTIVLCISKDLPFAQSRFCGANGIKNVITLSEFRNNFFSTDYGVRITNSPLLGLMARAIIVTNQEGIVKYTELVADISKEPNYTRAISEAQKIRCHPAMEAEHFEMHG